MKRRTFLGASATLSLAGAQSVLGATPHPHRRLLVILLRGGMDGLSAIPPIGEAGLAQIRPGLVPKTLLPGTSFFAVHPALPTFAGLLAKGEAVAVHATGFDYKGRSHFEGQDIMQSGLTKPFTSSSGWVGRAMQKARVGSGVAISIPMPLILRGDPTVDTEFPTWLTAPPRKTYDLVTAMWARNPELAGLSVGNGAGKMEMAANLEPTKTNIDNLTSPTRLAQLAGQRMAPDSGPIVGLIDLVGFDTHAAQGADQGQSAVMLKMIDDIILTYKDAVGDGWKDSLVITVTEFGRTVSQNGTGGSDHGWGGCILAAGGLVQTAGVIADWPGIDSAKLFEGRDLAVTVDARAVYAEVLRSVFGLSAAHVQDGVLQHTPHTLTQKLFKS
jgi:uncharacterized protein (DUF1501 family)